MIARLSRPRSARRGAVAAFTAVMLVVLLAMMAFAIDLSYWAVVHTEAQTSADGGAMAGAARLLERTRMATIEDGVPIQTADDLTEAKKEAARFAAFNRVGGFGGDLQDADIDIGYMASPDNHSQFNAASELDTTGWPDRPYNAVRVRIHRDKDHNGGRVNMSFAKLVNTHQMDVSATATAMFPMGDPTVNCGKVIPFAMWMDLWRVLIDDPSLPGPDSRGNANIKVPFLENGVDFSLPPPLYDWSIPVQDKFGINQPYNPDDPISTGPDGNLEAVIYPIPLPLRNPVGGKSVPEGNYGTLDIGGLSNPATVLERQMKFGPTAADYQAIVDFSPPNTGGVKSPQTEASFLASRLHTVNNQFIYLDKITPITLQGDPGISAGPIEDGGLYARGQVRLMPLFDRWGKPGNNAWYHIVGFAPVTIVESDLSGSSKRIVVQPTLDYNPCLDIDPNAKPVTLFAGRLQLVR